MKVTNFQNVTYNSSKNIIYINTVFFAIYSLDRSDSCKVSHESCTNFFGSNRDISRTNFSEALS